MLSRIETAVTTITRTNDIYDDAIAKSAVREQSSWPTNAFLLMTIDDNERLTLNHLFQVYELAQKTLVLLLEFNPDISPLLDWVVDRCFTGSDQVADGCFLALATIFSSREYPCDHYTAIINVTLMNTGCPRTVIHETALQLLQILDKRFFGSYSHPLTTEEEDPHNGNFKRRFLDFLLCVL